MRLRMKNNNDKPKHQCQSIVRAYTPAIVANLHKIVHVNF